MVVTLTIGEIVAVIGGLMLPGIGGVWWLFNLIQKKHDQAKAHADRLNEARDKARSEMVRHLHDRIDGVMRDYVRRDDLKEDIGRIERSVERVVELVAQISATVHQLVGRIDGRPPGGGGQ